MKTTAPLLLSLFIALLPGTMSARTTRSLNDGWKFAMEGGKAEDVNIPHCWNSDAYSTRDYRRGTGVYSRPLTISPEDKDSQHYLVIDGTATLSTVAVDGVVIDTLLAAYSSGTVNLTPYLVPGREHTLTVTVNNNDPDMPPSSADFTFMGGLYRDVSLVSMPAVHLDIDNGPLSGFKATTRVDKDNSCGMTIDATVINTLPEKQKVTIETRLSAPDGRTIANTTSRLNVKADSRTPFAVDLPHLRDIDLWSPDTPNLYNVELTIRDGKDVIDTYTDRVGFRTFAFDSLGRFLVNGEPTKLRGMCRHQDQAPLGIALTDEMHRRDMQMIKDLGSNFIRISHYPQDDAVVEMCDRLGLVAWEEIPIIDYLPDSPRMNDICEAMTRQMIRRHYNHPSIAMWGFMNEILLRVPDKGREDTHKRTIELARRLEQAVKEEDPTRLSTMAYNADYKYNHVGLSHITDVGGWNIYSGWYGGKFSDFEGFLSRVRRENPNQHLLVSEYGAGSDLRLHSLKPECFDFSIEYQRKFLEHYLPVIEDSVFVAGASHWNFIDFSSANRAESMPHINNKGLVTNHREPKDVYFYFKSMWTDLPDTVAHIASRDWPVYTELAPEGSAVTVPIQIYTNLGNVELAVNGRRLGRKDVANCTTTFDTPLTPGVNTLTLFGADSDRPLDVATVDLKTIATRDGRICLGTDELAVNVGSDCYFKSDDSGLTWLPDRSYAPGSLYGHTGGNRTVTQNEIRLTRDQPLLQRNVSGLETYRFDVAPGEYEVELSFAELAGPEVISAYMLGHGSGADNKRPSCMDIDINGVRVETDFAPYRSVGDKAMVKRRYRASATDALEVSFTPAEGATTSLSAIKIRKL